MKKFLTFLGCALVCGIVSYWYPPINVPMIGFFVLFGLFFGRYLLAGDDITPMHDNHSSSEGYANLFAWIFSVIVATGVIFIAGKSFFYVWEQMTDMNTMLPKLLPFSFVITSIILLPFMIGVFRKQIKRRLTINIHFGINA